MVTSNCSIRFLVAHPELDVFSRPLFFAELLVIMFDLVGNSLLMLVLLRTALLNLTTKVMILNNYMAAALFLPTRWVVLTVFAWFFGSFRSRELAETLEKEIFPTFRTRTPLSRVVVLLEKVYGADLLPFDVKPVMLVHDVAMETHQLGLLFVALSVHAAVRWPRLQAHLFSSVLFLGAWLSLLWTVTCVYTQSTSICKFFFSLSVLFVI